MALSHDVTYCTRDNTFRSGSGIPYILYDRTNETSSARAGGSKDHSYPAANKFLRAEREQYLVY